MFSSADLLRQKSKPTNMRSASGDAGKANCYALMQTTLATLVGCAGSLLIHLSSCCISKTSKRKPSARRPPIIFYLLIDKRFRICPILSASTLAPVTKTDKVSASCSCGLQTVSTTILWISFANAAISSIWLGRRRNLPSVIVARRCSLKILQTDQHFFPHLLESSKGGPMR